MGKKDDLQGTKCNIFLCRLREERQIELHQKLCLFKMHLSLRLTLIPSFEIPLAQYIIPFVEVLVSGSFRVAGTR